MDEKTRELVGIAASVAGHCRPCFQYHFKQAKKLGVPMYDISEAGDKGMHEFILKVIKGKKEVDE